MEKVMKEEEKEEAWGTGVWEMVKEGVFQRLLTWHLPSPPFLTAGELSSLTVVLTGCTNGIGLYTARELAMAGAQLIMACRNVEAADQIARSWKNETCDSNIIIKVEIMYLDLLSLSSVHKFAEKYGEKSIPLNALINNAGAFYMNEPQRLSEDGIDQHMQVNHIAPALLTLLLLPYLLKAPSSRIINVNSVTHHCALVNPCLWKSKVDEDSYHDMRSYGESKLAQLMFLKTLAAKLLEKGIASAPPCVAVNPGIVKTNIVKYPMEKWKSFWMLNPAEGARSVLFCLTSEKLREKLKKGFAYYTWLCTPAKEAAQAMDVDSCHDVWQKTMEILSLDVDYVSQITKC